MLVEKFDFIELLRLAIAQSEGKGKITKHVVLGEIALLPAGAKNGQNYCLNVLILSALQKSQKQRKFMRPG